jgi:hypothetical protein
MSTAARTNRNLSLSLLAALGVALIALGELGLAALSSARSTVWIWLIGTPLAYFLVAGAMAIVARPTRGALLGVIVGAGAVLASVLVYVGAAYWLSTQPVVTVLPLSAARPSVFGSAIAAIAIRVPIPAVLLLIFFAPFFVGDNLLGVGLATLGGLLGGAMRVVGSSQNAEEIERRAVSRTLHRWVAIVIVLIALALVVTLGGLFLTAGAFSAGQAR